MEYSNLIQIFNLLSKRIFIILNLLFNPINLVGLYLVFKLLSFCMLFSLSKKPKNFSINLFFLDPRCSNRMCFSF